MTQKKTGVQEWAEKSVNIQYGCEHNCRYCVSPDTRIILENHIEIEIKDL